MVAAELEVEDEVERCVRVGSASWVAVVLLFDIVDLDIIWLFVRVCFSSLVRYTCHNRSTQGFIRKPDFSLQLDDPKTHCLCIPGKRVLPEDPGCQFFNPSSVCACYCL